MSRDWFRRTDWSVEVERDFFTRLKRSRSQFHKAQYLRIQAHELVRAGGPRRLRKALDLIALLLTEYPDKSQIAAAHKTRGEALAELGDIEGAVGALRASMDAEPPGRPPMNSAYLAFGILAIRAQRRDLYAEALDALERQGGNEAFPDMRYQAASIRAIAYEELGLHDLAREHAQRAIAEAARTHSGFRYHPDIGLVKITDPATHRRLEGLATRASS
jgi:tetratricopeptide (TPR) repeat protein